MTDMKLPGLGMSKYSRSPAPSTLPSVSAVQWLYSVPVARSSVGRRGYELAWPAHPHPTLSGQSCYVSRRLLTENLGRASEIDVMSWHLTVLQG